MFALFAQDVVAPEVLHPTLVAALFAAGGGLAANLLTLLDLKNVPKSQLPDFKSIFYWLPFILMPLLGAGLAVAYVESGVSLKPIVAVNIGITAPLILRAMASSGSSPSPPKPPGPPGIDVPPGA